MIANTISHSCVPKWFAWRMAVLYTCHICGPNCARSARVPLSLPVTLGHILTENGDCQAIIVVAQGPRPRDRHDRQVERRGASLATAGATALATAPPTGIAAGTPRSPPRKCRSLSGLKCRAGRSSGFFRRQFATLATARGKTIMPVHACFGDVAQLVRVPDCRSGGCGFESRRPRCYTEERTIPIRLPAIPAHTRRSGAATRQFLPAVAVHAVPNEPTHTRFAATV